ncbi:MAG TPA: glycosyltransferase family 2 protein [Pirellulaceae bacterium]|jgi:glycosyltransferase involved in cell wall biosynthesis
MSLGLLSNDQPLLSGHGPDALPRLTVVAPLFNEADSIERLRNELFRLGATLAGKYETEFLLIDDGSTDETYSVIQRVFADDHQVRCVRHSVNRGLAAALATGIADARTPIVASIDADCTYEPVQLVALLECIASGVDMVVASPYHPQGKVVGVPVWRIAISKLASRLYRFVLRNQLHTYTSCFRVYRRSSVLGLPQTRSGFVGVVEMLWQLDRRGGTIVECPAVLTVRKTGQSKMRILTTALGHLRLLAAAAWERMPIVPRGARPEPLVARPVG